MNELVGRKVRLVRSGREAKGCCPFHGEKTPSFYVYTDHFHCFGCGAHGDAISFVMQAEGLDFLAAVDRLASEAGLPVPQDQVQAATRQQLKELGNILDEAQRWFAQRLDDEAGAPARSYLEARGVTRDSVKAFGLGWSGRGRGVLAEAIGVQIADMIEAGLMTRRADDGVAIDFFRDRLMFPICDQAGRVISFGGRTMGDGQPKYINGPETPLYSKRRALYGADKAREGLGMGRPLVVVEGYLDVISMHQAGETGTIAPLGSALTEEQLDELWRLSPAPVLLFDGDPPGQRAALHAMELALPKLAPDRTLKVAKLPDPEDPDSLLKSGGQEALRTVLAGAMPLEPALVVALRPPGEADHLALSTWRNRLAMAGDAIADPATAQTVRRLMLNHYFDEVGSRWLTT